MTVENLINIVRLGRKLTPAQSRAITAQLERIPAMEWTLERKDHDFAELSVAYPEAIAARVKSSGETILTNEESEAVEYALAECERLKEAVRWEIECADGVSENGWGFWLGDDASEELCATYNAAWRDVEGLL